MASSVGMSSGTSAVLAALALDGDGAFAQSVPRDGRVDAEALVDPQASVAGQIKGQNVVVAALRLSGHQEAIELRRCPSAVYPAEAASLQFDAQLIIGGQAILGIHLVVEEPDTGQFGLNGSGSQSFLLHILHITDQMLAADIDQLFKVEHQGQEGTEPLHTFIIAFYGTGAPLAVVPEQLIQLGDQSQKNAVVQDKFY